MGKLANCGHVFEDGHTVKLVNGITICPRCGYPTADHPNRPNPETMAEQVLEIFLEGAHHEDNDHCTCATQYGLCAICNKQVYLPNGDGHIHGRKALVEQSCDCGVEDDAKEQTGRVIKLMVGLLHNVQADLLNQKPLTVSSVPLNVWEARMFDVIVKHMEAVSKVPWAGQ